jgi:hypothetical protein
MLKGLGVLVLGSKGIGESGGGSCGKLNGEEKRWEGGMRIW